LTISNTSQDLVLEALEQIPVVRRTAPFYQEKCMVCLDNQGHASEVALDVEFGESNTVFRVLWSGQVTEEMKQSHADLQEAVEFAACAITFLVVPALTEMTIVEQASRGTTVDYYLAPKDRDDCLIFNRTARLEVSGILRETESNSVEGRISDKLRRLKPNPRGEMPTFVSVVEFGRPRAKVVKT